MWSVHIAITAIAIVDRFTTNVWPRQTFSLVAVVQAMIAWMVSKKGLGYVITCAISSVHYFLQVK